MDDISQAILRPASGPGRSLIGGLKIVSIVAGVEFVVLCMLAFRFIKLETLISPVAVMLANTFALGVISSIAIYHLIYKKSKSEAMREAQEARAISRSIIAAMGDAVSMQDTSYKIIYQNPAAINLLGNHIGEHCYEVYEHNGKVCESCQMEQAFEDGRVHRTEREALTSNGLKCLDITASPLRDSSGRIVAGVEVIRDVTQRRKMEKAFHKTARHASSEHQ